MTVLTLCDLVLRDDETGPDQHSCLNSRHGPMLVCKQSRGIVITQYTLWNHANTLYVLYLKSDMTEWVKQGGFWKQSPESSPASCWGCPTVLKSPESLQEQIWRLSWVAGGSRHRRTSPRIWRLKTNSEDSLGIWSKGSKTQPSINDYASIVLMKFN